MTTSKKQPSPKTELIKFNKSIVPFHIFDHENGLYSFVFTRGQQIRKRLSVNVEKRRMIPKETGTTSRR